METKQRILIDLDIWLSNQIMAAMPPMAEKQLQAFPVSCMGYTANVLFFFLGSTIHYTILWPDGHYTKKVFDIIEHIEDDFYTYISEEVQCTIAINYTKPIPQYRAVELFHSNRDVK